MSLGTLSIDIEARLVKLEKGMDNATRLIEQRNRRIESAFAGAAKAATSFVTLVGGLGLTAFARAVLDGVDSLNDFADATGTTVENASALEDVALRTGTSFEAAEGALVRFNKQLADAKPGSDGARIFKQLGLDAEKLRQMDPAEALLQTAVALNKYADDGNKARLVQELFGKSVREVAPFLKDLAQAGTLNATVTTEQAQEAERFANAIRGLQKDITDFARAVLNDALPAVTRFFREIRAAQESGGVLSRVFRWQRDPVPGGTDTENLLAAQRALDQKRADIAAATASRSAGGDVQLMRLRQMVSEAGQMQLDVSYYERLLGITNVQGGRGSVVPGNRPSVGGLPGAKASAARDALVEMGSPAATEALKRLESVDSEKLAALREQLDRLVRIGVGGDARGFEAARAVVEEIAKLDPAARAAAEAQQEFDRVMKEGRRVFEETRTPAEVLGAEIERLNLLLQAGAIDWDTYARAQFAAQDRFDEAVAKSEKIDDVARQLGMTFSSAFEDAIVNGEKFSNVLKAIERDLLRLVTRKLITEPLANWITTGLSSFSWTSLFAGRASGGPVNAGTPYLVGERGPEVVVPRYAGTVVPNQALGGSTYNVNVVVNGPVPTEQMAMVEAAVGRALARAQRQAMVRG